MPQPWGRPLEDDPAGTGGSGGEAQPAALHADLQAVGRLAAGVQDAAVQVAGQVAVGALAGAAAAAAEARVLRAAGAARGAVQDDVAQRQELAEQAGQDAVDAAVCAEGGGGQRERGEMPGAGDPATARLLGAQCLQQ